MIIHVCHFICSATKKLIDDFAEVTYLNNSLIMCSLKINREEREHAPEEPNKALYQDYRDK